MSDNTEPRNYGEQGMFDHVPTPEEIEAKAFMLAGEPWAHQWSWAAYICGLIDAGVNVERAHHLLFAACNGEFTGRVEFGPMLDSEDEDGEDE